MRIFTLLSLSSDRYKYSKVRSLIDYIYQMTRQLLWLWLSLRLCVSFFPSLSNIYIALAIERHHLTREPRNYDSQKSA